MEKAFQNAFAYRQDSSVIYVLRGDYFRSRQDLIQAEKFYLQALKTDPCRPGIYVRLAKLSQLQQKFDDADKYLQKAHQLAPRNPKYALETLRSEVKKL